MYDDSSILLKFSDWKPLYHYFQRCHKDVGNEVGKPLCFGKQDFHSAGKTTRYNALQNIFSV